MSTSRVTPLWFGAVLGLAFALAILLVGFSLIFGGVVLARMRALLADIQAEARLRRRAMEAA